MHFRGFSCPKNRLLPGLHPSDRLLPKTSSFVFGFRPQFLLFSLFIPCLFLVYRIRWIKMCVCVWKYEGKLRDKIQYKTYWMTDSYVTQPREFIQLWRSERILTVEFFVIVSVLMIVNRHLGRIAVNDETTTTLIFFMVFSILFTFRSMPFPDRVET